MRLIDADELMNYCNNQKDKTIDANDIARFPTIGGWISVKDRLPVETHSIFFPWYGKQKWSSAMWKEQSDKVIVTVAFKDGTRLVTTGETHDGVWHTSISRTFEPEVTHWMPMPGLPKEEHHAET